MPLHVSAAPLDISITLPARFNATLQLISTLTFRVSAAQRHASTAIHRLIACSANFPTSCSIMRVLIRPLVRTLRVTILNTCLLLPMLHMHHAARVPSLAIVASTTQSPVFPAKIPTSTCPISTNVCLHVRLPTSSMLHNVHSAIPTATNVTSQPLIAQHALLVCTSPLILPVSLLVPVNITRMIRPKVVRLALLLV